MLLKKLFRTLWQYKAQFISMVIMVALGIGVFFGFNVEWCSLEVNTTEIYDATGFADFRIYSDKGFSPEDLEAVRAIDGVEDATRFLSMNVAVKDDTDTLALTVSENMDVSGILLMEGEPYSAEDPDGFCLSDSYARANGISLGDKLTLTICRVDNNYQTKEFNVTVTLVEEKKEAATETTTSQNYVDPYEFYNDFFKGLF